MPNLRRYTGDFFRYLEVLPQWDPRTYLLCGSACLGACGVRDVGDLDVLLREDAADALVKGGVLAEKLPPEPQPDADDEKRGWSRELREHVDDYDDGSARRRFRFAEEWEPERPTRFTFAWHPYTRKCDFFVEPLRVRVDFDELWLQGYDFTHEGRVHRVQSFAHTMAIKALVKPKPRSKDVADIISLAALMRFGRGLW